MYWLPTRFSGFQRSPAAQSLARTGQPYWLCLTRLLVCFTRFSGPNFLQKAARCPQSRAIEKKS